MDAISLRRKPQSESTYRCTPSSEPGGKKAEREREKKKATRQRSRAIPANQRASDRQNALGKKQLHLHHDDVYEGFPRKGQTQAVTIDTEDAYQGPVQAANGHALAVMKSP